MRCGRRSPNMRNPVDEVNAHVSFRIVHIAFHLRAIVVDAADRRQIEIADGNITSQGKDRPIR